MARLAYLLVATLGLAVAACSADNPNRCVEGDTRAVCMIDSGMSEPMGCTDNAQCTSANAMVCDVAGDKTCVACLGTGEQPSCPAASPICDARACRVCKAHTDCASKACLPSGVCAAEGTVAYVDSAGTDNTQCTLAMPCTKLQKTIDLGRAVLKLHGSLDEGVVVGRGLTILADPGTELTRTANGVALQINAGVVDINDLVIRKTKNDNALATTGQTEVTLNHVTVTEAFTNGIQCGGKSMTINRSTIYKNLQIGVTCSSGNLKVTASTISRNDGGGISVDGTGTFDITNSFIVHNGTTSSSKGGLSLVPPLASTNHFDFNTVVDNHLRDTTSFAGGIFCDLATLIGTNNIIAHNDVNNDVGKANANTNGSCTYLSTTMQTTLDGLNFTKPASEPYDYHLGLGSTAIDKALTPSAIAIDFEGDFRPQGTAKDQGADEYKP